MYLKWQSFGSALSIFLSNSTPNLNVEVIVDLKTISTSLSCAWTWKSNNKPARTNLETKLHHPRHILGLNLPGPNKLAILGLGSSLVWGNPMKQVCRFATLKWSKGSDATSTLLENIEMLKVSCFRNGLVLLRLRFRFIFLSCCLFLEKLVECLGQRLIRCQKITSLFAHTAIQWKVCTTNESCSRS